MIDTTAVALITQPVDSTTYLLDVTGGMVIFAVAWWAFCFAVRNGIDGGKAVVRAIRERKPLMLAKILIGDWKPLGDTDPVVPHQPTIEDMWRDL